MTLVRFDQKELLREVVREFVHEGYRLEDLEVTLSSLAPVDLDMLEECKAELLPSPKASRHGGLVHSLLAAFVSRPKAAIRTR